MLRAAFIAGALLASSQAMAAQDAAASETIIAPAPSPAPRWVKGTDVELMVVREVNSRSAKAGERFRLRVNSPVTVNGAIAVPIGAFAWGEIVSVSGTSAAGGKGQLSLRLLHLDTQWGPVALTGTKGTEGASNTGGVILGVLGFGIFGLLNKGGNATFKAGDIIHGYIADGEEPAPAPLLISKQDGSHS